MSVTPSASTPMPPPPPPGAAPTMSASAPPMATGYGAPTLQAVGPLGRLGAFLLESVLMVVTLGVGWLIWAATTAGGGQTPAKKLLKHRVINLDTQQPATLGKMFLMRGIVGGLVANIAIPITLGILLFMPFWDKRKQNLWDKVSGTLVVRDPS